MQTCGSKLLHHFINSIRDLSFSSNFLIRWEMQLNVLRQNGKWQPQYLKLFVALELISSIFLVSGILTIIQSWSYIHKLACNLFLDLFFSSPVSYLFGDPILINLSNSNAPTQCKDLGHHSKDYSFKWSYPNSYICKTILMSSRCEIHIRLEQVSYGPVLGEKKEDK